MFFVKHVLESAVVKVILAGRFRVAAVYDLIFVKDNTLELVSVSGDGCAVTVVEQHVFDDVRDASVLSSSLGVDRLLLLTASGFLCIVSFDSQRKRFLCEHTEALCTEPQAASSPGHRLAVDLHNRAAAVGAFQSNITILPFLDAPLRFDKAIIYKCIGVMWSMTFLSLSADSANIVSLAVLLCRPSGEFDIVVIDIDATENKCFERYVWRVPDDEQPIRLIAVPTRSGHLILITDAGLWYLDASQPQQLLVGQRLLFKSVPGIVTASSGKVLIACATYDLGDPDTLYLLTEHGVLLRVTISASLFAIASSGQVHATSCMASLPNALLCLPGETSDGCIVSVATDVPQRLDTLSCLAPVVDSQLEDIDGDGQNVLVTCSGVAPCGSIRIVRNGIGVNSVVDASPPNFLGLTGIWTLRRGDHHASDGFSHMLISFIEDTRLLSIGAELDDVSESSLLQQDVATLAACTSGLGWIVQATSRGLFAVNSARNFTAAWTPPPDVHVTIAAVTDSVAILACSRDRVLVCVNILPQEDGTMRLMEAGTLSLGSEVSALEIAHFGHSGPVCIVGTYTTDLHVLGLAHGVQILHSQSLTMFSPEGISIPHCIRVMHSDSTSHVVIGARDGLTLCSDWTESFRTVAKPRRIGVSPVQLVDCRGHLLALSDRPWMLQVVRGQVVYTAVSFPSANHAVSIHSSAWPDGIAMFAAGCMHIISLSQRNQLDLTRIDVADSPKRLIYHKSTKRLILATSRMQSGTPTPDLYVVNPLQTAKPTAAHALRHGEAVFSMCCWQQGSASTELVLVGTGYANAQKGRLRVFALQRSGEQEGHFQLVQRLLLKFAGVVFCIVPYQRDLLLCSAGPNIYLLGGNASSGELVILKQTATRHFVHSICTYPTRIIVGERKDSVLVYDVTERNGFELRRADQAMRTIMDVKVLSESRVVAVDGSGSVLLFDCEQEADLRVSRPLHMVGYIRFGEIFNRVKRGWFSSPGTRSPKQIAMASSVLGSIIAVVEIDDENGRILAELQHRLQHCNATRPLCTNDHLLYRSRMSPFEGVIDGDFVNQFLTLTTVEQENVVHGWEGMQVRTLIHILDDITQQLK
eukprot:TRINITY_DN9888_c0_g1_i2.p1 TRINITY_DN9888_c0_g1~~TRINITY_DN9888_c0_g1_i2.p1  ORF type:complete len:1093 (-),score=194.00 TRINITY_DN9888_c0_g1_i2:1265-4543(-)